MPKEINLEEIIFEAYGCKDAHDFQLSFDVSIQMTKEIMLEFGKQLLKLAAENAKAGYTGTTKSNDGPLISGKAYVDKQSILDIIKQVK